MADRRELGREMCRRVADKVREVAPEGIGKWEPAWDYVAAPSDAFIDAVDAWVDEATPDTENLVRTTARQLVAAWREAGERFEEETRSTGREVPA